MLILLRLKFFPVSDILSHFVCFVMHWLMFVSVGKDHQRFYQRAKTASSGKSRGCTGPFRGKFILSDGDFVIITDPSHHVTKPTKLHVRPAKTQISLGIRPVWSESSLSACRKLGSLATHWAHSEDWSDWADAQAGLSLRWAHMPFCWFCHEAANL